MDILTFIEKSPCSFSAVANLKSCLYEQGYTEIAENEAWNLQAGGKYFVSRNESSLLAFRLPCFDFKGFVIGAAHNESPSYKVKWNSQIKTNGYVKLSVEPYGGMNSQSWLDRPLSVAGRVLLKEQEGIVSRIINIERDLLIIPGVAVHLNRKKQEKESLNPAVDMLPLYGMEGDYIDFTELVAEECGAYPDDIQGFDLFLYNRMKGSRWGKNGAFVSAPRIDDLACVYSALIGFLQAKSNLYSVPLLAVFDNEEVGSATKQGACSDFLSNTLQRINSAAGGNNENYFRRLASSFMISADNGHALHPNHPELSDFNHAPIINGGIVIKHNAAQRYCTDGVADGMFRILCNEAAVPYQHYCNRADIAGGSTLGNISNTRVSLNSVDIGLAQLAMHSAYETVGATDLENLCKVFRLFYGKCFCEEHAVYKWQ